MEKLNFLQNIHTSLRESGISILDVYGNLEIFGKRINKYLAFYLLIFTVISDPTTTICSMITPNGRFMTQKKICLSMSDCKF